MSLDLLATGSRERIRSLNLMLHSLAKAARSNFSRGSDHLSEMITTCLPGIDVVELKSCRLSRGAPALGVRVGIRDVHGLQDLRDIIFSNDFNTRLNRQLQQYQGYGLQVDTDCFVHLYEESMQGMAELTMHQHEQLQEIHGRDVHLAGPAGSGKTFIALQYAQDALTSDSSSRVLYISPSVEMGYHFVRWLVSRFWRLGESEQSEHRRQDVIARMLLLHRPYAALLQPHVQEDQVTFAEVAFVPKETFFELVVFDQAQETFHPEAEGELWQAIVSSRKLLLSETFTSSWLSQSFPEACTLKTQGCVETISRFW